MKNLIIYCLALLPFTALSQQVFNVRGELKEVKAGSKAYMIYNKEGQRAIDSADIQSGVFVFKGAIEEPTQAVMVIDHEGEGLQNIVSPDMLPFFLEQGTVLIEARDSISAARLSGTSLNDDLMSLNALLKQTSKELESLSNAYNTATEEQLNSEDFANDIQERYQRASEEANALRAQFIRENPTSLISLITLLDVARPVVEAEVVDPLYELLSSELKARPEAIALAEQLKIARKLAIGAIAPDFTQNDPEGKPVSLSSFRGQYVLLDFWASWCGPCRQENPNIVAAYNQYKDKNFTVLGVSLDRPNDKEKWLKAISDDRLAWTQVSDLKFWENEVALQYGIRSIPQSYLLDPDGRIIGKNLRGAALHEKLKELLL